jgi:hypothetical protein
MDAEQLQLQERPVPRRGVEQLAWGLDERQLTVRGHGRGRRARGKRRACGDRHKEGADSRACESWDMEHDR